jgi:hypothetical protein
MLRQCGLGARDEIAAIGVVVGMLELAPSALRKVTAWRHLMVRTRSQRPIVEQDVARNSKRDMAPARRHPVAAGRDPDNLLVH